MSNKKRIQKKIKLIERKNSIYKIKIQIKINLDKFNHAIDSFLYRIISLDGSFEDAQKIFEEQN